MMPIMLMMLIVAPVTDSAIITPMSDSGSESMIAIGSRKLPNWSTRIRYISSTAVPRARKICPNTSCWSLLSPPSEKRTPGGRSSAATRARMSLVTSPAARPAVLASTTTTRSRSRWSMTAGRGSRSPAPPARAARCSPRRRARAR
jgi:hypothetical protein